MLTLVHVYTYVPCLLVAHSGVTRTCRNWLDAIFSITAPDLSNIDWIDCWNFLGLRQCSTIWEYRGSICELNSSQSMRFFYKWRFRQSFPNYCHTDIQVNYRFCNWGKWFTFIAGLPTNSMLILTTASTDKTWFLENKIELNRKHTQNELIFKNPVCLTRVTRVDGGHRVPYSL